MDGIGPISASLSPGADARPAGDLHRPVDARFLGGICGGRAEAAVAAVARPVACLGQAVRRRDHGAGARSGPRPDQDRLLLGNRPRRPAVGRRRSAGGDLLVRARTGGRARGGPTKGLPRHPADRRLRRLQNRGQAPRHRRRDGRRGDPCALLGALPTAVLRDRAQAAGADRPRGPAADRGTVRDRGGDPRPERRTAAGPPAAADKAAARGDEALAAAAPCRAVAQIAAGRSDRYPLNQWDGLTCFLDDGRIEIDSNTVERSMRPIALNRKNALFAGHDLGAKNWAVLASLIETCKLHGVNPEAWLADVITRLVDNWPNRRLAELTPWAWQAAQNSLDRAAA